MTSKSILASFLFLATTSLTLPSFSIEKISNPIPGQATDGDSKQISISGNGDRIAYSSRNTKIVENDANFSDDIFLFDRSSGSTSIISVTSAGSQTPGASLQPSISKDGDHIVFSSSSTALTSPSPMVGTQHIYKHTISTGETIFISKSTSGVESDDASEWPDVSGDGRYVVFRSYSDALDTKDTNGLSDIFLRDTVANSTEVLTLAPTELPSDGDSRNASISNDGRYVFLTSTGTNLVSGDSNGKEDAFLVDRQNLTTIRISNGIGMSESNGDTTDGVISGDGNYAFFVSDATNLTTDDTGGRAQLFSYHIPTETIELISKDSEGNIADQNIVDVKCSDDGRFVTFVTNARNFNGEPSRYFFDVYLRDISAETTTRISIRQDGEQAEGHSELPAISGDGRYIGFQTVSGNLAPPDLDGYRDVLLADNPVLKAEANAKAAAAARAAVNRKISKLKKKFKLAKKKKKVALAKRLKKKIKKFKVQLRSI